MKKLNSMKNLYNVKEASEILNYHPEHVRKLTRLGKLECIKPGRDIFFTEEMLLNYINRGK